MDFNYLKALPPPKPLLYSNTQTSAVILSYTGSLFSLTHSILWVEMSKTGKKRDDEALFEGDEPPRKTSKTDNSSGDSDQIVICELSKTRKVSVRNWQGMVVVDIREFYVKDGKELPGKRGISLTMDQWKILQDHVDEIDQEVTGNA